MGARARVRNGNRPTTSERKKRRTKQLPKAKATQNTFRYKREVSFESRSDGGRLLCFYLRFFFVIVNTNESLRWCSTRLMIRKIANLVKQKYGSSTNNIIIVVFVAIIFGDMAQGGYRKVLAQQLLDSKYFRFFSVRVFSGGKILSAADEKLRQDSKSVRSKSACVAISTAPSKLRGSNFHVLRVTNTFTARRFFSFFLLSPVHFQCRNFVSLIRRRIRVSL